MPYLGDYLGQLLSEIAIARMQADLETVRLAELYAANPLLRTMAVPRFRLPEVDLDLPVVIQQSEEPEAGQPVRGGLRLAVLREKLRDVLPIHLQTVGIDLSAAERRRLAAVLDERIRTYGELEEIAFEAHQIANDLAADVVTFLEERPQGLAAEPKLGPELITYLSSAMRLEFVKLRSPPPRLLALVTSAEVQALDSPESVTRFRIKLTEQGVEWTTIESDGVPRDRLVPE